MAEQSYIGKGKVYLDGRFVGNVSELTLTINDEKKELPDYTSPGGGLRNSLRRITSVEVGITMSDYSAENLSMALYGSTTAVTAGTVTDESITAPSDLGDGDRLVRTANLIDTTQSVTLTSDPAGTTYVDGTDYTVSAAGVTLLSGGSISAGASLLIDYTKKAGDVIQALVNSAAEYVLDFDGLNEAQSSAPVVIRIHRAKFGGAQSLGFIADDFGQIQLTGDALADSSITTSGLSQYAEIKAA